MNLKNRSAVVLTSLFLLLFAATLFAAKSNNTGTGATQSGANSAAFGDRGEFNGKLIAAAVSQTLGNTVYDPTYYSIKYPGGDVPADRGVCTDVIIRAYRKVNIDLQKEVHEDMKANFSLYPRKWGLTRPDTNIDHRRAPNLQVFFTRKGEKLKVTDKAGDYRPGDLVTWNLPGNLPHIGLVTDRKNPDSGRFMIAHNIGAGPELEDMLFDYKITGHYKYPAGEKTTPR